MQFRFVDLARCIGAHRLEHGGKGELFAVLPTREHGPARNKDRGNVYADRAEEHSWNDFIAVSHEHASVEGVRLGENFRAVGDNLAGGEGITHSLVPHGDAVAHPDRGHDDGLTAFGEHAVRNRPCDFMQVGVSWNDFALRRNNAHDRFFHFVFRPPERAQKRSLRRHVATVRKLIHNAT